MTRLLFSLASAAILGLASCAGTPDETNQIDTRADNSPYRDTEYWDAGYYDDGFYDDDWYYDYYETGFDNDWYDYGW